MSQKTLLLVGLGPGLSAAVSRAFAKNGHRIAFIVRTPAHVADFEQQFAAEGIEAKGAAADASNPEALAQGLGALVDAWGVPDVLLYNVSIFRQEVPSEIKPEEFVFDFRLNVQGALVATQTVLPGMLQRGSGTLLYTGGGAALSHSAPFTSLGVGKAAMRHLVHCIADEVRPKGISVGTFLINGAIKPGTPFGPEVIAPHYYAFYEKLTPTSEVELIFNGG